MKCKEFHECVCEIIDKRLPHEQVEELMQHAHKCPHCNYELEALDLTKRCVNEKLGILSVPQDVYSSIIKKTVYTNSSFMKFFTRFFDFNFLNPAVAFVMILTVGVGIYSLFTPQHSQISDERNIISQSLKNYQAVIGGTFKPAMISHETEEIHSFLEKNVQFDVIVPKMTCCDWCGGVLSDFNGLKLAHVVYKVGNSIMYIYQADMKDVMNGTIIELPSEAKESLAKTDWYVRALPNKQILVMWQKNNTLCSAVSDMGKDKMIALLTEKDEQPTDNLDTKK